METKPPPVVSRISGWPLFRRWCLSTLVASLLLVASPLSPACVQATILPNIEVLAGTPIPYGRLGCYSNNKSNEEAADAGRAGGVQFQFTKLVLHDKSEISSEIIQSGSTPYLNYTFAASDQGSVITCFATGNSVSYVARYQVTVLSRLKFEKERYYVYLSPRAYDKVPCPYSGSRLNCTWEMNTAGPFTCKYTQDNICPDCSNLTDCYNPSNVARCSAATPETCFEKLDNNGSFIRILPGCYGCLKVTATSTIFGKTESKTVSYMLLDLQPVGQACAIPPTPETGPGLTFLSPTKSHFSFTLPQPSVTISVTYRSQDFQSITLFRVTSDGTQQVYNTSNLKFAHSAISYESCMFKASLTILDPVTSFDGRYAFKFRARHGTVRWSNFSVSFNERPCEDDMELNCKNGGSCILNSFNAPRCVCPEGKFGRQCDFECPPYQIVNSSITFLEACTFITVLFECPLKPGAAVSNSTIWYHDGLRIGRGALMGGLIWEKVGITRADAGNYSCHDGLAERYLGSVTVYVASDPVLEDSASPAAAGSSRYDATLVANKSKTYGADDLTYAWYNTEAGSRMVCGQSLNSCIRNRTAMTLEVLQVPGCEGLYAGCLSNTFGTVCRMFNITFNETICPANPIITTVASDPERRELYPNGEPYVDIMARKSIGCSSTGWYMAGKQPSPVSQAAISTVLPRWDQECCWRCVPGVKLPDGNVTACATPPSSAKRSSIDGPVCARGEVTVTSYDDSTSTFGSGNIVGVAVGSVSFILILILGGILFVRNVSPTISSSTEHSNGQGSLVINKRRRSDAGAREPLLSATESESESTSREDSLDSYTPPDKDDVKSGRRETSPPPGGDFYPHTGNINGDPRAISSYDHGPADGGDNSGGSGTDPADDVPSPRCACGPSCHTHSVTDGHTGADTTGDRAAPLPEGTVPSAPIATTTSGHATGERQSGGTVDPVRASSLGGYEQEVVHGRPYDRFTDHLATARSGGPVDTTSSGKTTVDSSTPVEAENNLPKRDPNRPDSDNIYQSNRLLQTTGEYARMEADREGVKLEQGGNNDAMGATHRIRPPKGAETGCGNENTGGTEEEKKEKKKIADMNKRLQDQFQETARSKGGRELGASVRGGFEHSQVDLQGTPHGMAADLMNTGDGDVLESLNGRGSPDGSDGGQS